jgi:hypothetical protein
MKKMKENYGDVSDLNVSRLSLKERDTYFEQAYTQLFHIIYPERNVDITDKQDIGALSYVTVYDLMNKRK